jgi:hypothetical protein
MKILCRLAILGFVYGLFPAGLSAAELRLTALPTQGSYPLTVSFQAVIMDADRRDPDLYCLDEDWDFDHVRFFERRDCPPFEDGTEIDINYSTTHTFDEPGTYRVRLALRRGDELVLRADAWVRVLSVQEGDDESRSVDIMNVPVRAEVSDLLRSPGEYTFRTVIVKGRLDSYGSLDSYVIRDRRWYEQSIVVVFRSLGPAGIPVGDDVEVMGQFRTTESAGGMTGDSRGLAPSGNAYIIARSVDSLEYDLKRPSDFPPSSELPPPKPVAPKVPTGAPPELVFTLPLDEEQGIDLDTEFRLQFSEDMDPESFEGNVALRYGDEVGTPEPAVELDYDVVSRTLTVRAPRLEPGREVNLILFEGIIDDVGVPLASTLTSRRSSIDARTGRRKALLLTFYTRSP